MADKDDIIGVSVKVNNPSATNTTSTSRINELRKNQAVVHNAIKAETLVQVKSQNKWLADKNISQSVVKYPMTDAKNRYNKLKNKL